MKLARFEEDWSAAKAARLTRNVHSRRRSRARVLAAAPLALLATCRVAPPPPTPVAVPAPVVEAAAPFTPSVVRFSPDSAARLSAEGRDSVSARLAPGLSLKLWAPEPMIADPIGLSFDDNGRLYVTRTTRTGENEIDIRAHRDWMVPSITFSNVEDKRAFYQRILAPENSDKNQWLKDFNGDGVRDWHDLTVLKEELYRIEDTNGDGIADVSTRILQDFNDLVSDVAHDVLWYKNSLYLTVSPDLWRLRDTNGDGVIDTKESLAHGSGVHIGFGGHGLSSPIIGPDGRLYWKQGDLGVNITTRDGRKLVNPWSGVIMRANPDGTDAELFATGLRNPQDFTFDEYGNLIAPDNDGDHPGEFERLVYVVDGMEVGWRINWQFGKYVDPDNNTYKVWMDEKLFQPRWQGQAAYITPPLAPWHAGPSGFDYNPGTALGEAWRNMFFSSSFPGEPGGATIQGFRLAPQGASFRLASDSAVIRGVLTTGVKFGPDGALYLADWIRGWGTKGRGRIWKVDVTENADPLRAEVRTLIAADFATKSTKELVGLLHHQDMRIRRKAQFALVDRNAAGDLAGVARKDANQLARIHAIWGIGQLARADVRRASVLAPLLIDRDPEIRAQAAKMIGDVRFAAPATALVAQLADTSARARFFAAEALGRIRYQPAITPLIAMLAANDDRDTYLRHAGVTALARIGDPDPIVALADNPSRAVRLAAVVVLRRMHDAGVARFLNDRDELVVTEAARAINDDRGIADAFPALAAVLDANWTGEPLVRRAISANLRVATPEAAQRVARYAARSSASDALRREALAVLAVWPKPSILDRVDGSYIGAVTHDSTVARAALAAVVEPILASTNHPVQVALLDAVGRLRLTESAPSIARTLQSAAAPELRVAALKTLVTLRPANLDAAMRTALQDAEPSVRTAAISAMPGLDFPEATTAQLLASVVEKGTLAEQQSAVEALGKMQGAEARAVLARLVERASTDTTPSAIQLDIAEAAKSSNDAKLKARVEALEKAREAKAPRSANADLLSGGDARRGQRIVNESVAAQCVRCHTFTADSGASVGPRLLHVASRLSRDQLLEALLDPSARISPGFGPVQLTLRNGQRVVGTLMEESDAAVVVDAGGSSRRVAKGDIARRVNGPSAMPPMGTILSRRELRDVLEYLSSLK